MSQEPLRVEFRVEMGSWRATSHPEPGEKAERQREDRAALKARTLALAYWIDHLVHTGQVADLATVAKLCGVSRARVSAVVGLLEPARDPEERLISASGGRRPQL